jgi:hypothetical protein
MLSYIDFLASKEHYKDLLQEAERYRLIRQVLAGRERGDHFHCRALTWLGRRLVAWGWRLQERYNAVAQCPHSVIQVASDRQGTAN